MKTTEDRQRIEQAAIAYTGGYNTERHDSYIGFVKGAEYATIYERDKFDPHLPCVKENKRDLEKLTRKLQEHKAQKLSSLEKYQLERIEKLEAERTELKEKIERYEIAFRELKRMRFMKDDMENFVEQGKIINEALNSLKTK